MGEPGKDVPGLLPWYYEVFVEVVVDDKPATEPYRNLDAVFVSQCQALETLDPQDGELIILEVERLEPDPEDAHRGLAFGVQLARRPVDPEAEYAWYSDTYNVARNVPR